MYNRIIDLSISSRHTCFLWGARQTGKSTLLRERLAGARRYDLLQADEYRRLLTDPTLIRQELRSAGAQGQPVVIDEVQKIPDLLDEVHWLIENAGMRFVLCGSSARKLKRGHANLLGGRAVRRQLFPLVWREVPDFSLDTALNSGMLPPHYLSADPRLLLRSYVGDYLREEVAAEALTRNVASFSRFLEVAALGNGDPVSYATIARECGVSAPTVRSYYEILQDTLLGDFLPAFRKRAKRRVVETPKFYLFDTGVVAELTHRGRVEPRSELFGKAFEHFLYLELAAHRQYSDLLYPLAYWRTSSQFEVDFVLGDGEVAIEVKSTDQARDDHTAGLRAFRQEHRCRRALLVSCDPRPRTMTDGIEVLPWEEFLGQLWSGRVIG